MSSSSSIKICTYLSVYLVLSHRMGRPIGVAQGLRKRLDTAEGPERTSAKSDSLSFWPELQLKPSLESYASPPYLPASNSQQQPEEQANTLVIAAHPEEQANTLVIAAHPENQANSLVIAAHPEDQANALVIAAQPVRSGPKLEDEAPPPSPQSAGGNAALAQIRGTDLQIGSAETVARQEVGVDRSARTMPQSSSQSEADGQGAGRKVGRIDSGDGSLASQSFDPVSAIPKQEISWQDLLDSDMDIDRPANDVFQISTWAKSNRKENADKSETGSSKGTNPWEIRLWKELSMADLDDEDDNNPFKEEEEKEMSREVPLELAWQLIQGMKKPAEAASPLPGERDQNVGLEAEQEDKKRRQEDFRLSEEDKRRQEDFRLAEEDKRRQEDFRLAEEDKKSQGYFTFDGEAMNHYDWPSNEESDLQPAQRSRLITLIIQTVGVPDRLMDEIDSEDRPVQTRGILQILNYFPFQILQWRSYVEEQYDDEDYGSYEDVYDILYQDDDVRPAGMRGGGLIAEYHLYSDELDLEDYYYDCEDDENCSEDYPFTAISTT